MYASHLGPASLGEFARLFAHAERSKGMLPSMIEQLLSHDNLLLSGEHLREGERERD